MIRILKAFGFVMLISLMSTFGFWIGQNININVNKYVSVFLLSFFIICGSVY